MNSSGFVFRVLGLELLAIALGGALIFFYARAVNERQRKTAEAEKAEATD